MVAVDRARTVLDVGVLGPASRVGPIARGRSPRTPHRPAGRHDQDRPAVEDLYAVAVMLWEMLSGKRLFVGSTHQAVTEKVRAGGADELDSSKPSGATPCSTAVADIVAKAMDASADARFEQPKALPRSAGRHRRDGDDAEVCGRAGRRVRRRRARSAHQADGGAGALAAGPAEPAGAAEASLRPRSRPPHPPRLAKEPAPRRRAAPQRPRRARPRCDRDAGPSARPSPPRRCCRRRARPRVTGRRRARPMSV